MVRLQRLLYAAVIASLGAPSGASRAEEVLPKPPEPFAGRIDADRDKAVPAWPRPVTAPEGAPNILLVLLDDVGFGATSAMGGPVETPELEKLAASGLLYNRFHVTAMCSPTRAALLSGRNSHQLGFGAIAESASGYPGYDAMWSPADASVAEVLRLNGYSTAAFGKWHNTPPWEIGPAGPFDRWPTGLGFEYFYGFMGAAASQWEPQLWRNTVAVDPPATPDQGYQLTTDLVDDAIRWLHRHDTAAPGKPFFVYFAPGATHAPHQVAPEWIEPYRGRFDGGWDRLREDIFAGEKRRGVIPADAGLSPRPAEFPAWETLPADEKRLFARQMEVYAGFLAQTDHEIGRLLQAIADEGQADNTLVLYIVGDNGASAEGGRPGFDAVTSKGTRDDVASQLQQIDRLGSRFCWNLYAGPWAWATDAPFPWAKEVASHLGGITDPLIVSWPARIRDRGSIRGQFHHVIDIAPTLYEVAGIPVPDVVNGVRQTPLEGTSLADSFDHPQAPGPQRIQYFETLGNRGIYAGGWFAGRRFLLPWGRELTEHWTSSLDQHPWELYDLEEDYSQAHDLSARYPEKLTEMVRLFDQEAQRNQVYPIAPYRVPRPVDGRTQIVFRGGAGGLSRWLMPDLSGRSHRLTADVIVPAAGAEGVIAAAGGRLGGFSLYLRDGRVIYALNSSDGSVQGIASSQPVPAGAVRISFEFVADGSADGPNGAPRPGSGPGTGTAPGTVSGTGRLKINGTPAGEARFAAFRGFASETFDVGRDSGSPVSDDYPSPYPFTGRVGEVILELK